jgi:hypothetical protein
MPDFRLESPDDPSTTVVTGSPGERARLLAQGYRDITDDESEIPEPTGETAGKADTAQPTVSRKADTKTETRNT